MKNTHKGLVDYHVHTAYSNHASGAMEEYVEHAIRIGLSQMGFSDHLPWLGEGDVHWCIPHERFEDYLAEVDEIQRRYPEILILLGVEADFVPGLEDRTQEFISRYAFDYVIGSVHFIDSWNFDDSRAQGEWLNRNINEVYATYWGTVAESAETGLFSVIGHCDLLKKFGTRPTRPLTQEMNRLARRLAQAGVVVEVNTSGLRLAAHEIYPALELLSCLARAQVPVTLGSDAHNPADVGRDFARAIQCIERVGYDSVHLWQAPHTFEAVCLKDLIHNPPQG